MKKKFLFWNVKKNNLSDTIINLAKKEVIDVIVLAEADSIEDTYIEKELTKHFRTNYNSRYISGQKIMMIDNLPGIKKTNEDERASSCLYSINGQEILVVGVHLRSKKGYEAEDLYDFAGQHRQLIDRYGIKKVIITGDFNMAPYEKGIMGITGFNAIMSKEEIRYNPIRTFGYMKKSFYFNPSWDVYSSYLPHKTYTYSLASPLGTYHFSSNSKAVNPYWHLLDQVLISAQLMDSYVDKSFKIITEVDSKELLRVQENIHKTSKRRIPDCDNYSDHLPITFEIDF
ncbi:endonuclease/exonuclease/phosphatase family protein [Anaerobacillus alkaliphilus]|uniref:Endonuclease/exonuclease/phosphatase family protein n=1 Tax=Anaerobacillus alkaliphilus TaxID=1548597 RepID=A0A4Q0VUJ1_9BACI|nr:endonuclease/exonuclease/phosphatase family protein [Anaerobacillus alkaliphilus]RXJ02228.1 endonuclease/exonuclease/phosphatase family protein [Anaerobacillus alkaliphilus]